jgi:alcohol oxidase
MKLPGVCLHIGEVVACHPQFSPGSPAACRETDDPVPINAPDIVYSGTDDEAIAIFNRDVGESSLSDRSRFHF